MSLEGPKTLRAALSPGYWNDAGLQYGSWETISLNFVMQRTKIDLTGLSTEDLTTFLSMVDIQRSGIYASADDQTTSIPEWILITDTPWHREDIAAWTASWAATAGAAPAPGFIYATDSGTEPLPSWVNVLYGAFSMHIQNSTLNNAMVTSYSTTWGSGGATASDTLYIYRICILSEAPGSADPIIVPAMNIFLGVVVGKEADLAYIERLRRSYILQEGRDVD